jgi:hypothetical protein
MRMRSAFRGRRRSRLFDNGHGHHQAGTGSAVRIQFQSITIGGLAVTNRISGADKGINSSPAPAAVPQQPDCQRRQSADRLHRFGQSAAASTHRQPLASAEGDPRR